MDDEVHSIALSTDLEGIVQKQSIISKPFWNKRNKIIVSTCISLILIVIIAVPSALLRKDLSTNTSLQNNNNNNAPHPNREKTIIYNHDMDTSSFPQIKCNQDSHKIIDEIDMSLSVKYQVPFCSTNNIDFPQDTPTTTKGKWYTYVGTGSCLDIRICTARIRLLDKDRCWLGKQDTTTNTNSGCNVIQMESEYGETYHLYVDFEDDNPVNTYGFVFSLACPDCEPTAVGILAPTIAPTISVISNDWKEITNPFYGTNNGDYTGGSLDDHLSNSAVDMNQENIVIVGSENASPKPDLENAGMVQILQLKQDSDRVALTQLGPNLIGDYAEHHFGTSVSISSNSENNIIVAVGSPDFGIENDKGLFQSKIGHVRVFQYIDNTQDWLPFGSDLIGDSPEEEFGFDVSLNGDGSILAVGSRSYQQKKGCVQIYQYNVNIQEWESIGSKIVGDQTDSSDGRSISLDDSGSIVAIGGPHYDDIDSFEVDNGRVRIYEYNSELDSWNLKGNVLIGIADSLFGFSVHLSQNGTRIAIGARWEGSNDKSIVRSGSVRIYQHNVFSGTWDRVGEPIFGDSSLEQLGVSVKLSADGNIVAAGALGSRPAPFLPWNGGNYVSVYQYDETGSVWSPMGKSIQGESGDRLGESLAVSQNEGQVRLVVGAALALDENDIKTGCIRFFEMQSDK